MLFARLGMTQQLEIVCFVVLGALVFVWFILVSRFFDTLRSRHTNAYLAMGAPTLIVNNSIQNTIAFLRFLLRREDRKLNDPKLSRLCQFMVVFFWTYLAILVAFVLLGAVVNPLLK